MWEFSFSLSEGFMWKTEVSIVGGSSSRRPDNWRFTALRKLTPGQKCLRSRLLSFRHGLLQRVESARVMRTVSGTLVCRRRAEVAVLVTRVVASQAGLARVLRAALQGRRRGWFQLRQQQRGVRARLPLLLASCRQFRNCLSLLRAQRVAHLAGFHGVVSEAG